MDESPYLDFLSCVARIFNRENFRIFKKNNFLAHNMGDALPELLPTQNPKPNGIDHNPEQSTLEFKKKVEESKAKMHAEAMPPKRGPGRPRKNPAPPIETPVIASAPAPETPVPTPDITQDIKPVLKNVSKIPAARLNIPELALTEDEAQECAICCNRLLQVFAPNLAAMSPKTAAVVGAISVFGTVAFQKYQIYLAKTAKPVQPPEKQETQPAPTGEVFPTEMVGGDPRPATGPSAQDYYRNRKQAIA